MSTPAFVTLDALSARSSDATPLFDDLTLAFGRERTGLVGRNGVGKTTLLRLMAGEIEPASGTVARAGSIGVLRQNAEPAPDERVVATLEATAPLAVLGRILKGEGDEADLAVADWSLEDGIAAALSEVGLGGLPLDRLTTSLSGGEQTRLRLAALLLAPPDLILLDEPTNNLDAGARALVTEVIGRWKGGAVVVSHDRALLRHMDRIVELSSLGATTYGGNYDLYVARKSAERDAALQRLDEAERDAARVDREAQQSREKKARRDKAGRAFRARASEPKMLLDARKGRAEASGGRENRLADRLKDQATATLEAAAARVERTREMALALPPSGLAAGKTVLVLDGVRHAFAPQAVSSRITGPERVAITGPNGSGKTTLLRVITGDLPPTSGRIERPVAAVMLDQHAAILAPDETLIEAYRRLNPEAASNDAHAALARFLFRNTAALRTVGTLSGGERLRAAIACVMGGVRAPQLLILDEPTNHLDLESIAAIEGALSAYDGALIVVSHDEDFLDAIGVTRRVALTPYGSG